MSAERPNGLAWKPICSRRSERGATVRPGASILHGRMPPREGLRPMPIPSAGFPGATSGSVPVLTPVGSTPNNLQTTGFIPAKW
jgi:hypothetical protein